MLGHDIYDPGDSESRWRHGHQPEEQQRQCRHGEQRVSDTGIELGVPEEHPQQHADQRKVVQAVVQHRCVHECRMRGQPVVGPQLDIDVETSLNLLEGHRVRGGRRAVGASQVVQGREQHRAPRRVQWSRPRCATPAPSLDAGAWRRFSRPSLPKKTTTTACLRGNSGSASTNGRTQPSFAITHRHVAGEGQPAGQRLVIAEATISLTNLGRQRTVRTRETASAACLALEERGPHEGRPRRRVAGSAPSSWGAQGDERGGETAAEVSLGQALQGCHDAGVPRSAHRSSHDGASQTSTWLTGFRWRSPAPPGGTTSPAACPSP